MARRTSNAAPALLLLGAVGGFVAFLWWKGKQSTPRYLGTVYPPPPPGQYKAPPATMY